MAKQKKQCVEEDWKAAQAALNDAQKLPGSPERFEALKRAGRLRYEADKRRLWIEKETDRKKKQARVDSEK